jgi:hypothetical protein
LQISLLRELVRFARDDVGWFFMVLLFFLTTSTLVTVYWLHHYPPIAPELPDKKEPRVYGLTKHDVRRLVRKTGAIFSFFHLGTVSSPPPPPLREATRSALLSYYVFLGMFHEWKKMETRLDRLFQSTVPYR